MTRLFFAFSLFWHIEFEGEWRMNGGSSWQATKKKKKRLWMEKFVKNLSLTFTLSFSHFWENSPNSHSLTHTLSWWDWWLPTISEKLEARAWKMHFPASLNDDFLSRSAPQWRRERIENVARSLWNFNVRFEFLFCLPCLSNLERRREKNTPAKKKKISKGLRHDTLHSVFMQSSPLSDANRKTSERFYLSCGVIEEVKNYFLRKTPK